MHRTAALLILPFLLLSQAAHAKEIDCTSFMSGNWAGKGSVDVFGQSTNLDNTLSFNADGTFKSDYKYQAPGQEWAEQVMEGTWTVKDGDAENTCEVTMANEGESEGVKYSSSSTSTFVWVDADTLDTMGFLMQRVAP